MHRQWLHACGTKGRDIPADTLVDAPLESPWNGCVLVPCAACTDQGPAGGSRRVYAAVSPGNLPCDALAKCCRRVGSEGAPFHDIVGVGFGAGHTTSPPLLLVSFFRQDRLIICVVTPQQNTFRCLPYRQVPTCAGHNPSVHGANRSDQSCRCDHILVVVVCTKSGSE